MDNTVAWNNPLRDGIKYSIPNRLWVKNLCSSKHNVIWSKLCSAKQDHHIVQHLSSRKTDHINYRTVKKSDQQDLPNYNKVAKNVGAFILQAYYTVKSLLGPKSKIQCKRNKTKIFPYKIVRLTLSISQFITVYLFNFIETIRLSKQVYEFFQAIKAKFFILCHKCQCGF